MSLFRGASLQVFSVPAFRMFVAARFFLTLGIQMQFATIYLQVYYEHSRDELMLGLIGLAEAVPFIITSLFSGHYADRLFKKKIIVNSTLLLTAGAVLLFLNAQDNIALLRSGGLYTLFGVVFVFGIIRSFLAATTNPFITQLVPRTMYTHSATWNSTAWHAGAILGPVLSGILYGAAGGMDAAFCHMLEAVFIGTALVCFILIRNSGEPHPSTADESIFRSMSAGIRFVFSNRMVLSAISLDLFAVLFGGAVALIPAFTDKILHQGPEAYGLLRTAPAIGAVLMAVFLVVRPPGRRAGKALLVSVVAFGLFTILFAISRSYWVAFTMLLCTGAFDNVSVVVRHSILQLMTPDDMRGRVSAINSVFIGSSNEIGAFESGVAARLMGLVPSIIFGGAMTIGVVAVIDRLNPRLRRLDLNSI
jgi:MFS family permease